MQEELNERPFYMKKPEFENAMPEANVSPAENVSTAANVSPAYQKK